jgi:hypothetical protein
VTVAEGTYRYELIQILPADYGWVANFRAADGEEWGLPVVMWALAEARVSQRDGWLSLGRRVVGLVMDDELGLIVADDHGPRTSYSRAKRPAP